MRFLRICEKLILRFRKHAKSKAGQIDSFHSYVYISIMKVQIIKNEILKEMREK